MADEDETRVLVFERYANGMSSIDAHVKCPAHAELLAEMGERNMTKRFHHLVSSATLLLPRRC